MALADLAPGQLDLHLMPVTTGCEDDLVWLSGDEQARARRFRRTTDRVLFIQAHGLLRRVLSRYAAVAPPHWHFVSSRWGKPALCPRHHPTLQALRFNLSHCTGRVAVAVAWAREVGVDIERFDALAQPEELAPIVLGPRELADWQRLGADRQLRQRFLMTRWTLKEAALKALGLGIGQVAPHQLDVWRTDNGSGWLARPDPAQPDPALQDWARHGWLCCGLDEPACHWALACERRAGETITWRLVHHQA